MKGIAVRWHFSKARRVTDKMIESRSETLAKFLSNQQKLPAISARLIVLVLLCTIGLTLRAQEKSPFAGDAKAAKLGESQFRANCAFCHGLGARGGGRGPDLSRAQKRHGNSDAELFRTINEGAPGTAMPPNRATQQRVGMTQAEIWQMSCTLHTLLAKAPYQPVD